MVTSWLSTDVVVVYVAARRSDSDARTPETASTSPQRRVRCSPGLPPSVTFTVPTTDLPSTVAEACSTFVTRWPPADEPCELLELALPPHPARTASSAQRMMTRAATFASLAINAQIKGP